MGRFHWTARGWGMAVALRPMPAPTIPQTRASVLVSSANRVPELGGFFRLQLFAVRRGAVTGCVTAGRLTPGVTRIIPEEQEVEAMNATDAIRPMSAMTRTQGRCLVCGFSEIRTDEVVDRGVVFLAECPRCDHRWTSSEPIAIASTPPTLPATTRDQRVPARVAREVLPAA